MRREADARLRRAAEALPPDCAALAAVEVDGVFYYDTTPRDATDAASPQIARPQLPANDSLRGHPWPPHVSYSQPPAHDVHGGLSHTSWRRTYYTTPRDTTDAASPRIARPQLPANDSLHGHPWPPLTQHGSRSPRPPAATPPRRHDTHIAG